MGKLTEAQERALIFARPDVWLSASQIGSNAAACGGLVRRGLLVSAQQREHPLGEKPFFYKLYKITPAGRAALSEGER